jgi:para-nitrobenzyl esterase
MAPQTYKPLNPFWGNIPESGISEDCLYLNVVTPAKHKNERLPVLVWVHGGGINTGTDSPDGVGNYMGAEGGYLAAPLPNHGAVVVTIQHRIGPLGYMAHPELTAESPHHASGNYGQLDLIASLQWVRKNIAAFGGDPHNVTFFGQSGGGSKTLWVLASPLAKGLLQRALVQAGCAISSPLNPMSMCKSQQDAEANGLKLQAKAGVSNLAQLRALKWQDIVNAVPGSGYVDTFTIDGYSLLDSLYNTFKAGNQNDVPFIIGAAEGEPLKHLGIQLWADALLTGRSNVYVYLMAQVPSIWKSLGVVAWHGSDVAAEFGDTVALKLFPGALLPITLTQDPGVTEEDVAVSEYMMTMLVQFAETGDPSVKGVRWPPFSLKSGKDWYIDIEYPVKAKTGYMELYH